MTVIADQPEAIAQMKAMRANGASWAQIGAAFGVSSSTARYHTKEGLKEARKVESFQKYWRARLADIVEGRAHVERFGRTTPEDVANWAEFREHGFTVAEIATLYNCSLPTVYRGLNPAARELKREWNRNDRARKRAEAGKDEREATLDTVNSMAQTDGLYDRTPLDADGWAYHAEPNTGLGTEMPATVTLPDLALRQAERVAELRRMVAPERVPVHRFEDATGQVGFPPPRPSLFQRIARLFR